MRFFNKYAPEAAQAKARAAGIRFPITNSQWKTGTARFGPDPFNHPGYLDSLEQLKSAMADLAKEKLVEITPEGNYKFPRIDAAYREKLAGVQWSS